MAAYRDQQTKQEDHKRRDDGKREKDTRLDRHSAMGVDPNPKKGGHGGWGEAGIESDDFAITDPRDPNHDSGGEEEVDAN